MTAEGRGYRDDSGWDADAWRQWAFGDDSNCFTMSVGSERSHKRPNPLARGVPAGPGRGARRVLYLRPG